MLVGQEIAFKLCTSMNTTKFQPSQGMLDFLNVSFFSQLDIASTLHNCSYQIDTNKVSLSPLMHAADHPYLANSSYTECVPVLWVLNTAHKAVAQNLWPNATAFTKNRLFTSPQFSLGATTSSNSYSPLNCQVIS